MATSNYQVTVQIDAASVQKLVANGFNLFGFKGVQAGGNGAPLVWVKVDPSELAETINISWQESYQAYFSGTQSLAVGTVVTETSYVDIALSQTTDLQNGVLMTPYSNTVGAIGVNNTTGNDYTAGISQQSSLDSSYTPICAFPLLGNMLDTFIPVEKVLLFFATSPYDTGSVIEQAMSPGVLIDCTSPNTQQTVSYSDSSGWTWQGTNASSVSAQANIAPILFGNSPITNLLSEDTLVFPNLIFAATAAAVGAVAISVKAGATELWKASSVKFGTSIECKTVYKGYNIDLNFTVAKAGDTVQANGSECSQGVQSEQKSASGNGACKYINQTIPVEDAY